MKVPYNRTYERQNKMLIPATFKKAVVSSFSVNNKTANVYISGNSQTIIKNIPLATSIDINKLAVGQKCRVDCFDENNANDMVVAYTY